MTVTNINEKRYSYHTVGNKYDNNLDVKDIAKLIRADIKKDIKKGILPEGKYSVKIDRYSMGQSIDIKVKELNSPKLILNPHHVVFEEINPHFSTINLPSNHPARELYTEEGQRILARLKEHHRTYNFDDSDSQSDYFSVNYYGHPEYDWGFSKAQKELILENSDSIKEELKNIA